MSHVDEGTLHAYLDGALDEYPAGFARRVREHLDACATCAAKLEEERRVREDARSILGRAAPDIEVPTFEDLRAHGRAIGGPRRSASTRLYRLGWAASVVVALGVGWLLRGGRTAGASSEAEAAAHVAPYARDVVATGEPIASTTRGPAADRTAPVPARASGTAMFGAPLLADAGRGAADASADANTSAGPDPSATGGLASPAGPVGDASSPDLSGVGGAWVAADIVPAREVAAGVRGPALPTAEPLAVPPMAASGPERVTAQGSTATTADATAKSEREAEAARRSAQGQLVTSAISTSPPAASDRPAGDGSAGHASDGDEADAGSLVVPGLELIAVLPVGEGRTFKGMRALQRLENGDTLEVVHLAEGVAPSTLPPVRVGSREIVLERGAGWVVLRGPRTEAELLALMQRLASGK